MPPACPPLPPEDLDHVLLHTRDLWAEARGKSFFITGGTGFFGMWLLESFARINDALGLGMHAVVLTRNPPAFVQKAPHLAARSDLRFLPGDVRTFEFPSGDFPYIIHAATEASAKLNEEAPQEMLDAIIGGTRRVLDFARSAGTGKFLLTSSGAVYGLQPANLTHVPEDFCGAPDPLGETAAYGEGKRVSELLGALAATRSSIEMKIGRCFAFVGPHLPLDGPYAVGNFLRDALNDRPIRVAGDGSPFRSYLYAADLAIWLWTLLFRAPSGRAYNVGSAEAVTIGDLAQRVARELRSQHPVEIAVPITSGKPASIYVPSIARARDELGLIPRISLADGLARTAAWHRLSLL